MPEELTSQVPAEPNKPREPRKLADPGWTDREKLAELAQYALSVYRAEEGSFGEKATAKGIFRYLEIWGDTESLLGPEDMAVYEKADAEFSRVLGSGK